MLDAWIRRMAAAKVLMGEKEGIESELSGWLELIDRTVAGEAWAETELLRLVAVHARNLGAEGRPASAVLTQIILLDETLAEAGRAEETRTLIQQLLRLVADAHEAGVTQRLTAKHRKRLSAMAPVIRLGERAVVGFLLGPMQSELLDALVGRVLRETVRCGAEVAVIDCLAADRDDELFHRTIAAMQKQPPGDRLRVILTGLRDPERSRQDLARFGVDLERVSVEEDVNAVVAALIEQG